MRARVRVRACVCVRVRACVNVSLRSVPVPLLLYPPVVPLDVEVGVEGGDDHEDEDGVGEAVGEAGMPVQRRRVHHVVQRGHEARAGLK